MRLDPALADRLPELRRRPSSGSRPGLTVVVGDNGEGKTNLLEAVGYLATLTSFRGAPGRGAGAPGRGAGRRAGRGRAATGARAADRGRDRRGRAGDGCRSTASPCAGPPTCSARCGSRVFAPDDLELVKGGPAARRRYLDDLLVALHPRHDALRRDLERVLRQRNALLRAGRRAAHARRRAPPSTCGTPSWPRPARRWATARAELVDRLEPAVAKAYAGVAGPDAGPVGGRPTTRRGGRGAWPRRWPRPGPTTCAGACAWSGPTATSWRSPSAGCRPAPTPPRASSGRWPWPCAWPPTAWWPTPSATPPVLLLDDVFSELDPGRSRGPPRPPPARPGPAHHRRRHPRRRRARPGGRRSPPAPARRRSTATAAAPDAARCRRPA